MTLEEFLDLDGIEHVVKHGHYFAARCPAHEDKEPSLSIWESEEGWIKLRCWAGCEEETILDKLGLENKDLRVGLINYAEPDEVFPYQDEQGDVLFEAVRFPGKKFRQRHLVDGEWVWNLDGVRRVLYRLPEVIRGVREGKTIFVVEGEKDAEALREADKVATCNPMGAGKWRKEYTHALEGARVIVVADRDEPGRAHARAVRESLQGVAREIYVVQAKTGKDAYDHLNSGHTVEDFVPVRERIRRGLITASELAEQAREDLELRASDLPGYTLWHVGGLENVVFRQGRAYTIGAYTGDGKTSTALQGLRNLCAAGTRCGYFSLEMPERDLRNKLLQHKGIPLRVLEEPWSIRGGEYEPLFNEGIEEISAWNMDIMFDSSITAEKVTEIAIDREYEVVFVDHLHRFAWGSERRKLDEQVNKLTNLALESNITLIVLCQLRKFSRGRDFEAYPRPSLQDFRETSMIGDDSSMALSIWRQRDNSGMTFTGGQEVTILKNRHTTGHGDAAGRVFFPMFDQQRGMFVTPEIGVGENNGS